MITLRMLPLILGLPLIMAAADAPVIWQQPTDLSSRDLIYGSGGKDDQPLAPFTFLEEDKDGTNPKFDVRDAHGTKWKVKLGEEARPETAASRFVWAVGYVTDEYYFLPSVAVAGLPAKLNRGNKLRLAGDIFANVRLKRTPNGFKKTGTWKWKDNPFLDSQQLNGLRTLMAVLNNWDLKDENNAVLKSEDGKTAYVVSDLGATFGTDHLVGSHEVAKGNLASYRKSKFIVHKSAESVDFGTPGKPSLKFALDPKDGLGRVGMQSLGKDIPLADARWMGNLLGQLTPLQIRDGFRSGGFSPEEIEAFALILETRIADLKAL